MTIDAWELKSNYFKNKIQSSRLKAFQLIESETGNFDADGVKVYSCEYDQSGNMVREAEYGPDGELDWICSYSYDSQGRLTEETIYTDGNVVEGKTVHTYNAESKLAEVAEFGDEAEAEYKTSYIYNGDKLSEEIRVSDSGEKAGCCKHAYDAAGNRVETVEYDADDNPVTKVVYKFDSNNNLVEETIYACEDSENLELDSAILYVYDDQKRLVERQIKNEDMVFDKINYKYDEKNNIIEENFFERDDFEDEGYSTRVVYEYDAADNIVKETEYELKDGSLKPMVYSKHVYEYHA